MIVNKITGLIHNNNLFKKNDNKNVIADKVNSNKRLLNDEFIKQNK